MTRKLMTTAALAATALTATAGSAVAVANDGAHSAATKTIRVLDDKFSPTSTTVSRGTKLRFVWGGRHPHNVIGPGANASVRVRGSYTATAKRSGTYYCSIHSRMRMKVTVR
ncbi:MAG: hypothetical protein F2813_03155 [Actinobacteria bacterium]|uniref:Unannotated protein n=1 Tax=freshwater metagenome TaxID=449393 RepID=A0A6J5ZGL6_9ZZZZ|nr:hypothetical protein [Actinomycetota bacterium]